MGYANGGGGLAIRAEGVGKRYFLDHARSSVQATGAPSAPRWEGAEPARAQAPEQAGREEFWALRDIAFDIRPGEAVGIVGRNGAGKSTLLKLMSRITPPTTGRIEIRGRVVSLLEVGTGFHPELTGRENVFLNGAVLGMRRKEIARRFDEIVEYAGVERFLDTPVKHYSSGMYTRLAFAVAAHLESEILFVDEVLSVGDREFQQKCLGKMRDAAGSGRAVFFVSHNLQSIQQLCTRAFLIDDGRLVRDGTPGEVVGDYIRRVEPEQDRGAAVVPADMPRRGDGRARLRRVAMTDVDGRELPALLLGQPFRVVATFEVHAPFDDAAVEVGINTVDGQRAVTVHNIDEVRPPFAVPRGEVTVAVDLEATILPGDYTITVGIHGLSGFTADYVEDVLRFTALNEAAGSEDRWPWRLVRGSVRVPSRWTLAAGDPAAAPASAARGDGT